jgi:hypothetical protein
MAGTWIRLAHAELSSAGDTINTGDFTPKDNLKIVANLPSDGNLDNCKLFVGTGGSIDTGSNYAFRHSTDGAGDGTNGSMSGYWFTVTNVDAGVMLTAEIINKSGREKLIQSHAVLAATGAGTAPQRAEVVGKWVNTSGQINTIRITNSGTGDFEAGSYITVWGASDDVVTDEKDALTDVEVGTRYEETDTRKIYRRQGALTSSDADHSFDFGNNTSWSFSDSQLSISSNAFQVNKTNGSIDGSHATYDLGTALSSTFVFRFKANFSTLGLPTNGSNYNFYIGVRSTAGHNTSSNDDCSISFDLQDQSDIKVIHGKIGDDDSYGGGDWGTNYPSSGSVSEDTDYYITYIRTSTGFTVQIRSGSHTGTLLYDSDKTSSKTPTGLQYIWLGWSNRGQSTGADWVGTIDDFEIYDGVTSLDATWKERGTA